MYARPDIFTKQGGLVTDLRSWGCGFNTWSGRYQVITTSMGDCSRTDLPSRYYKFNQH